MKNIQMPESFLTDVYRLIGLLEGRVQDENIEMLCKTIETQIKVKLERMEKRELYTAYKTGETDQQREEARQEYLDKVGMKKSFRYNDVH